MVVSNTFKFAVSASAVVVLGIAVSARAGSPDSSASDDLLPCAVFSFAAAQPIGQDYGEVSYDVEADVAEVIVGQQTWRLDGEDPACRANPDAARVLDQERAETLADLREGCADMHAAIAEGRTHDRGVPVNLDGARQYIEDFC